MVPLQIHVLQEMPLTPNRKIDRKSLASSGAVAPARPAVAQAATVPAPAVAATASPAAAPRQADTGTGNADLEARIGRVMATILGLPEVQAGDNFFQLGGHSLLAVQLHRTIRDELGITRSSITDIFRFPVLRDLASHLDRSGTKAAAPQAPAVPVGAPVAAAPAEPAAPPAANDLMAARRALRARIRPQGSGG